MHQITAVYHSIIPLTVPGAETKQHQRVFYFSLLLLPLLTITSHRRLFFKKKPLVLLEKHELSFMLL
jgi:hypothetical protein